MLHLTRLINSIQKGWIPDTSNNAEEWSSAMPARGQCVPSALVVQDYFGGDIIRFELTYKGNKESHYCNLLDNGTLLDVTRSQYPLDTLFIYTPVNLQDFDTMRERLLSSSDVTRRYLLLKQRTAELLEEKTELTGTVKL